MYKSLNNYAFIDGNNFHITYEYLDWKVDYNKFRNYLAKKYNITKVYYFMGLIPENRATYDNLKKWGYSLKLRDITIKDIDYVICHKCGQVYDSGKSRIKCDCDADIVLQVLNDINNFDKAILITSDGDFDHLVEQLIRMKKLELVLAPCKKGCSHLLLRAARGRIAFIDDLREELEYIKK
jgi:uncharacterized LabA/DUF88 family protein